MLFHVAGRVFGFLPGVSFLYNQCLPQREGEGRPFGHPVAPGPQCRCGLRRPLLVFLEFLPFTTKNTFSVGTGSRGALGHLSLAELTQSAPGRLGCQKHKPASSQLRAHVFIDTATASIAIIISLQAIAGVKFSPVRQRSNFVMPTTLFQLRENVF